MHIVIDAHLAVKKIDGIARYLNGLLSELPGIDRSINYTILSLPAEQSSLPEEIFAHSNVGRFEFNIMGPSPRQHLITGRLLNDLKADVYHHPQYDLPIGVRVPAVITIHDLKYIFHAEFLRDKSRLKRFYIKNILRRSLKVANQVIAVSESTLTDLRKISSFNLDKASVIYHGMNAPITIPEKSEFNSINSFDISKKFILFVGTRRPHKNIEGLIRALAILRNEYNHDVDVVIAGKAYADYTEPERCAHQLNVDEHTHFIDFVPDDILPELYAKAQVVALISFYEGFGLPLLEAMAYGTPAIGSNVSSIPEVIGDAGLLVDPHDPNDVADKIHSILTDTDLRNKLVQNGLNRVQQFTWRKLAESTLDVYLKAGGEANIFS